MAIINLSERFPELTFRQCEIGALVVRGFSAKAAARHLGLSKKTVEDHKRDMFARLKVKNSQQMLFKIVGAPEVVPGSAKPRKSHCVHGHEYTAENTKTNKDGSRACRTCVRLSYHARNKASE